jgi:hypothetical protein
VSHVRPHRRVPARAFAVRLAVRAAALLAVCAPTACRPAGPAFGATPAEARANAESFFGGIANRFTNVQRTPKFAEARAKLGRHALSPSRIFGDTGVWTGSGPGMRSLTLGGRSLGNRYLFEADASAPAPTGDGDSWHHMRLRHFGGDVYEWATAVDMAVGRATPTELLDVWRALLATAARTPEAALRAEYRLAVPRATRVMGRLATLDTLDVRPLPDGSAAITVSASLHPDRLSAQHPHFAQYVTKYVQPARYAFTVSDRRGARWIVATARQNRLSFRLRATRDGRLAPLDGAVRAMPDTLVLRGEAFAKFSVFTVGMREIEATVAILDDPRERGFELRFREEPDWEFPLAVNHLISAALRRPFSGEGMQLRLALRQRADGRTVIARRVTTQVQEGAIVRWLGGLGAGAMDEFAGRAEEDENRFTAALFDALADDFSALAATAARVGAGAP